MGCHPLVCRDDGDAASLEAKEMLKRRFIDAELPYELLVVEASLMAYVK